MTDNEIIAVARELVFTAPISKLYAVVDNPEYDPDNYSESLYMEHRDWDYMNNTGPLYWQDTDESNHIVLEDDEHKIWRLNHNKKFKVMMVTMCVTPKKVEENKYMLDDETLNNLPSKYKSYTVRMISNIEK